MKFHLGYPYADDRSGYQRGAIESVCDLFCGQESEPNQCLVSEPLAVVVWRLF